MKDSHKQAWIETELIALSRLLLCWAQPEVAHKRRSLLPHKLDLMADGVVAGLGDAKARGREVAEIPAEVRRDDRDAIECMLKAIKSNGARLQKGCFYDVEVDTGLESLPLLRRRLWLNPESVKLLASHLNKKASAPELSEVRNEIIGTRLDYEAETIKRSKRTKGKPIEQRKLYQKHLASLFFDVVRYDAERDCMTMILDALGASRYHPLQLYYLTRSGPLLNNKIKCKPNQSAPYLKDQTLALCEAVISQWPRDRCPSFRVWNT